ncbi:MAG: hypothetical protein AB7V50_06345, partial [Vampirovibrionia bacterium]
MSKIGFGGKNIIDIIKYRYVWFGISAVLLIPCIVFMAYSIMKTPTHSPVRLGIDFTGGTFLQYGFKQKLEVNDIASLRKVLSKVGQENAIIQIQEPTEILGNLSGVNESADKKSEEVKQDEKEQKQVTEDKKDETTETTENKTTTKDEKTDVAKDLTDKNTLKTEESTKKETKATVENEKESATVKTEKENQEALKEDKVEETVLETTAETTTKSGDEVTTEETLVETPGDDVKTVVSMRVKFLSDAELKELNSVLRDA